MPRKLPPHPEQTPEQIKTYIEQRPLTKLSSEPLQALARRLVAEAEPESHSAADHRLAGVQDYLAFLDGNGVHLPTRSTVDEVFDDSLLAGYEQEWRRRVQHEQATPSTENTLIDAVLLLGRDLGAHGTWVNQGGHTHRVGDVEAPTTADEFAGWDEAADHLDKPLRIRFRGYLHGSRGAALDTSDYRVLTGRHIPPPTSAAVVVHVPGPHVRDATCLDRHADPLLESARYAKNTLLIGRWPHRDYPVTDLLDAVDRACGGVPLRRPLPRLLRRAYVAELLSTDTSPLLLQKQLGGDSLSEIEKALPFASAASLDDTGLRRGAVS